MYRISAAILVFGLVFGISSYGFAASKKNVPAEPLLKENRDGTYSMSENHMGTVFSLITADDLDEQKIKAAFKAAFEVISEIEKLASTKDPNSGISKINANAGIKPVKVDPRLFDMISRAIEVSRLTNGAFDITFAALADLWNFKSVPFVVPKDEEIKKRLPLIGYQNIVLNDADKSVFLKKKGMKIGLGGIAKGYAADLATMTLEKHGLSNFIIYAGGDLMVRGIKGDREWKVGIQDPFHPDQYFAVMPVSNKAVVTSGDYEHAYEVNGKYYHHIIDTKTGYPSTECHQVTVVADYATYADALCTGFFVLGPNVAIPIIERMPGVDAVMIDMEGNVYVTSGLKDQIKIKKDYNPKPAEKKQSPSAKPLEIPHLKLNPEKK